MEILQIQYGDPRFHYFENFPKEIYPPHHPRFRLRESMNQEFLVSCFVLLINNKVQARAALYHNPTLGYQEKETWCVGNYEAMEKAGLGKALLQAMADEAKINGAEYLIGPMNGSTFDTYRFQLPSPNPDFFMEPVHPPYYPEQFKAAGFAPIARYFSSRDKELKCNQADVLARQEEFLKEGITFRNIKPGEFEQELERIHAFNTIAFKTNFLFTPISREAFIKKNAGFRDVIMPEFTILAEDMDGNLIGYFFCIEDFLNTKEKCLIVKTLARHPDNKWKGLGHVIGNMIYKKAIAKGYTSVIHALVYEEGTSIQLSKNFSGEVYKNYVLYGKDV